MEKSLKVGQSSLSPGSNMPLYLGCVGVDMTMSNVTVFCCWRTGDVRIWCIRVHTVRVQGREHHGQHRD